MTESKLTRFTLPGTVPEKVSLILREVEVIVTTVLITFWTTTLFRVTGESPTPFTGFILMDTSNVVMEVGRALYVPGVCHNDTMCGAGR